MNVYPFSQARQKLAANDFDAALPEEVLRDLEGR
jgi:hypothetical protein